MRVFWQTAPEQFRIAAILTALDCYCALGTRLRAKYVYDLEPHAMLIQLLVLGEPGSGKSFTRPIVKQLLRPLKLKDIEQKRIEQAYQDLKRAIEGGNCTRKILTRIDDDVLGEDAPQFRQQTEEERALITKTVNRLMEETYTEDDLLQPTHLVDMEWIESSVRRWLSTSSTASWVSGASSTKKSATRGVTPRWPMVCGQFSISIELSPF